MCLTKGVKGHFALIVTKNQSFCAFYAPLTFMLHSYQGIQADSRGSWKWQLFTLMLLVKLSDHRTAW